MCFFDRECRESISSKNMFVLACRFFNSLILLTFFATDGDCCCGCTKAILSKNHPCTECHGFVFAMFCFAASTVKDGELKGMCEQCFQSKKRKRENTTVTEETKPKPRAATRTSRSKTKLKEQANEFEAVDWIVNESGSGRGRSSGRGKKP